MILFLFWGASVADPVLGGGRAGRQEEEYKKSWYEIQLNKQWDGIRAHRAAVELGRQGGLKGGPARAETMSPKQRSLAAASAARARWK